MKCCSKCFKSPHLKDKINRNELVDNCDFCETINVSVIEARELLFSFQSILDLYLISENGKQSANQIVSDFPNIFLPTLEPETVLELLSAIFADDLEHYGDYLNKNIILECNENPNYQKEVNSLHLTWENFVQEIKSVNRFHIQNVFDFDKLEHLLKINTKKLEKGKIFYRGRISDKKGYPKDKMWNPPAHLANGGRANPVGISYLYIANDLTTTLFETRAALHDYVSIGEFRLKEDIQVIDLKEISNLDPFDLAQSELLENYVAYLPFLQRLGDELSKPVRRNDSDLDYLPTQYLTEFIKSINSDAVVYGSSLNKTGYNLAVFYPEKFECIKVSVYEIMDIEFQYNLVSEVKPTPLELLNLWLF